MFLNKFNYLYLHFNQKITKFLAETFILISVISLISCTGGKGDDLDKFILESGKDMKERIDPLPVVKPYAPIEFNADGTLIDPFKARKVATNNSGVMQPDQKRPKEPLEAYPLNSLYYVGSIFQKKINYALIKTPDNTIQQVKIGNYIGQNYGIVTDVSDTEVKIKEIVEDPLTESWVERNASIILQE